MKIALFSTQANGGAGRAAMRLASALASAGHDARAVVLNGAPPCAAGPDIRPRVASRMILERFYRDRCKANRDPLNATFSFQYPGVPHASLARFAEFDLLNLHWISFFLSIENVAGLAALGKPVVWTLHDKNAFTGGCHCLHGCAKFAEGCEACPQLRDDLGGFPALYLATKAAVLPSSICVCSPSEELAALARKSRVFARNRIEVIKNSVETEVFVPGDRAAARRELGFADADRVVLFGAEYHRERHKGMAVLRTAIKSLVPAMAARGERLRLMSFGEGGGAWDDAGIERVDLGYVRDDALLAKAYRAADVFVLPSLEENLPNTMLESLACGTPVAAFAVGGMPDVVRPGETGALAEPGDPEALARSMTGLLLGPSLRAKCREYAERELALGVQSARYAALFEDLVRADRRARAGSCVAVARRLPAMYPILRSRLRPYLRAAFLASMPELCVYPFKIAVRSLFGGAVYDRIKRSIAR